MLSNWAGETRKIPLQQPRIAEQGRTSMYTPTHAKSAVSELKALHRPARRNTLVAEMKRLLPWGNLLGDLAGPAIQRP